MNIEKRMEIERRVVRKLIRVAKAHGYALVKASDGEEVHKVSSEFAAMEVVFSVDESWLYFKKDGEARAHCAFIVLGNGGYDAICDASVAPGWDDVMEEVFEYCNKLELAA